MKKKGQIQITFNWIYIAIAGAVILLFFLSIVVKQAKVSEEKLSGEVVRILDSIMSGARVSEKTKNSIDASGLVDYILYFDCDEGVSEFGIKGKSARIQNSIDPVFGPKEINTARLNLWSLPYKLPFKIIDFLFITSENIKYFLIGNNPFIEEFLNETEPDPKINWKINREHVPDMSFIKAEKNFKVRIIGFEGTNIPGGGIPDSLSSFDDKAVSAVVFTGVNQVDFYQKEGTSWKKLNRDYVNIISLGGERDAAKYAAIFAGDDKTYQCNMKKAFKRLEILTEVYGGSKITSLKETGGKLGGLVSFYAKRASACLGYLVFNSNNANLALNTLNINAKSCRLDSASCLGLIDAADELNKINDDLRLECVALY